VCFRLLLSGDGLLHGRTVHLLLLKKIKRDGLLLEGGPESVALLDESLLVGFGFSSPTEFDIFLEF